MKKMLHVSCPLFLVKDLQKSMDYYCDILGFTRTKIWGDPPSFSMPCRDELTIMLQETPEKKVRNNEGNWDAYFWVEDAQALYDSFKEKGAFIEYKPEYMEEYGNLEFAIKDPDGYFIAFGQDMHSEKSGSKEETIFQYMSPVLASSDVRRDMNWYQEKLGFKITFDSSGYEDNDAPLNYAAVGRQNLFLHMQFQYPNDMTSTDIRFQVKNISPLFNEYIEKEVIKKEALKEKTAWGTNEFSFFDPSGNRITFYEDI